MEKMFASVLKSAAANEAKTNMRKRKAITDSGKDDAEAKRTEEISKRAEELFLVYGHVIAEPGECSDVFLLPKEMNEYAKHVRGSNLSVR